MPVNLILPHPEYRRAYAGRVADRGIKAVLWANVRALMVKRYGEENINRLARDAKLGPATVQRIKDSQTSVGIEVLEKIAKVFDVEAWQLIAPGLSDEKFLDILRAWQDTDGRGRRMLLRAAEGAAEDEDTAAAERSAARTFSASK